jgi:DNA-3-methyladenine glycosylase
LIKGGSEDGFILIRALEPTRGVALMQKRRKLSALNDLGTGPGKLTQAISVRGTDHGISLCEDYRRCFLQRAPVGEVIADKRIGISKAAHHPWRFLLKESPYVSRRAARVPVGK